MGTIKNNANDTFRDYSVDGVPASGSHEPVKQDIRSLFEVVDVEVYAAQAGITTVPNISARDVFFAIVDNQSKLVYVNNNNGSALDPLNGVYEFAGGAARIAVSFYQGVAVVVQPLVDEAEAAKDDAEAAAADAAVAANAQIAPLVAAATEQAGIATDAAEMAAGFLGGIMYASTSAGLAAVAEGAFFTVVGDGVDTYAILYQKVSGVAVKKADLPSRGPIELLAASGTDDAPMINAMLAAASSVGGAVVKARNNAQYQIEDTLLIGSRTTLDLSGSAILNISGDSIRMISNPAMLDAGVSCTVSWTAGLEATVSQTAHGFTDGEYSWLRGANQAQFRGVFRVLSVTDVNTYIVQLWRVPTTTATGTITAVKADTDITLIGADLDYDYPNTPVGIGYRTIATYFSGVANLTVNRYRCVNAQKYALCVASANGYVIDGLHCPVTNSDGLKLYGPLFGGSVSNIFGLARDDFVTVHPREYDVFADDYQISNGDIIGLNLSNIAGYSEAGKGFALYPTDSGPIIDGVTLDGLHSVPGDSSFGAAISVHTYSPEVRGVVGSFVARNVTGHGAHVLYTINSQIGRLDLHLDGARPTDKTNAFIRIDPNSVINQLIIGGRPDGSAMAGGPFITLEGGRIDHLIIDKLHYAVPTGYFITTTATDATLKRADIRASDISTGSTLVRFSSGFDLLSETSLSIRDSSITAVDLVESAYPMRIDVSDTDVTLSQYFVNGATPPSGTMMIRVSTRNAKMNAGGWLNGATNVTFAVFSADIEESLLSPAIARVDGGFFRNIATGIGTITEAGIVDCHGTASNSWRVRGDPVAQRY